MSRIQDLVQRLCPHGVPSRSIADFTRESSLRNRAQTVTEVRSVTNSRGLAPTSEVFENTRTSSDTSNYKVVQPGMFVYNPSRINVGSIAWLEEEAPVIVSPMYVVFGVDRDVVLPDYLMLFLGSRLGKSRIESKTEVGARFRLTYASLSRIVVPVPPIPIQQLVVRELDRFIQLDGELRAELEARRRQYDHYRAEILASNAAQGSAVRLGDVASVRYGSDFPKIMQGSTEGDVPFFKVIDMAARGNDVIMERASNYVAINELRQLGAQLAPAGTILLPRVGAAVATNRKRMLGVDAAFDTSFIAVLPGPDVRPRFLLHQLVNVDLMALSNKGAALPSVRRAALENLPVFVPSLAEQDRLNSLLEQFETLVTDMRSGIPGELAARRKQYEYYRDKLLTFEEVAV